MASRSTCAIGLVASITWLAATVAAAGIPVAPYESDGATALLLHLDGNVSDASGFGRKCGLKGGRWTEDGVIGKALSCDGRQEISVPVSDNLADGFTAEAWVRLERPAKRTTYRLLAWKGALELFIEARDDFPGRPVVYLKTDRGRFSFRANQPILYRKWVHLACVYDPAAKAERRLSLYVCGRRASFRRRRGRPSVAGRLTAGEGPLT